MKKFAIIYGQLENDIQKRAVEELSRILLDYTIEYPVCSKYDESADMSEYKSIYIGTKESNPYIRNTSKKILSKEEEYFIKVENNTVVIEGFDDAGVLYGVLDFYNKYIVKYEYPDTGEYWVNFLEKDTLPDFEYTSSPSVKERGLWTWGHVIYDYRGYFDNMMKLKMNRVIIWNDFLPVNAEKIVRYAHSCNIKVIWGFAWLWDTNCNRFDLKNLEGYSEEIFEKYETEYSKIDGDGIYFQTFTELGKDNIDGVLIAEAAAKFVNRTATLFYEKYPDMELQFGLHATSVRNRLDFIKTVDPRIRIVWEDCGSFPFSYVPKDISTFEKTKDLVKSISQLRGEDDHFGVVTKGLVNLDWAQFEHLKGSQCIGVSSEYVKGNRIERKTRIWRYIQACWLINSDKAYEMVREMFRLKEGDLSIFALVEDGMFEENIMYPVALYSEMLWDCHNDIKNIVSEVALRNYVCFA
ncbi:MAG: hypothetical protein IJX62_03610 [Clostridia bacterium]|nr:hypothetical protein [Clostridia bacterium]